MKKNIYIPLSFAILLSACGAQNDVSFDLTPGNCPDGTTNAPYCMALKIQNNAGGQNFINSSNQPISNIALSVTGASNLNYPTSSGGTLDPNGCLGKTLGAGASCTFYVKLSGESIPVGLSYPVVLTATYDVKKDLFASGGSSANSSTTFYQVPNLIITNSNGLAKNFNNQGVSTSYIVESGMSQLNSTTTDAYYGFLYAASGNGLYLSGNQNVAYNKTESQSASFNNIIISSNTIYPVSNSTGTVYYSSVNPISSIYWNNRYSGVLSNAQSGIIAANGNNIYLATNNQVSLCYSNSGDNNCVNDATALNGKINSLAFSNSLGVSSLTGLVVGTSNGLFVESGFTNTPTGNTWSQVLDGSVSIQKTIVDNLGNVYAVDSNFNIYQIKAGNGNVATKLTTITGTSGSNVSALAYDNSGQILYVASNQGNVYGCFESDNGYSCDVNNVINSGFGAALFGLNIVTSLTTSE